MYNDQLVDATIHIDNLYLDPNNPRFWSEHTRRHVPDSRIKEPKIQSRVEDQISRHGIEELHFSILRNGFLPLDRIVVRPIAGDRKKYVVVEGNRRLAALRLLRQRIDEDTIVEDKAPPEYLDELIEQTNNLNVLIFEGTDSDDISWILQGIRHIGGIRNWEPAQRAKLVADQIDEQSAGFTETGQKFGLSSRAVGRLYRAYKALEQMRGDDEFGKAARNDYFSLFEEAYRNRTVRHWLDWSEDKVRFDNASNLKTFYSWITPDEDMEGRRRIHEPKNVKSLGRLIEGDNKMLMSRVDQHDIDIEVAESQANEEALTDTWRQTIERSLALIQSLSVDVISENPEECRDSLIQISAQIGKYIKMAESLLD